MRIQDHIGLISWSLADKALFILYGLVTIVIMNFTMPAEFGLFSLLLALHTWIFTISDSFSLQSLIQFGMKEENRGKVNLLALISHVLLTFGIALVVFFLRYPLAALFNEPRILDIASFLPVMALAFIPRTYSQKIIYRIQNMFYLFLTNFAFFGIMTLLIFLSIANKKMLQFNDLAFIYLFGSIASSLVALFLIRKELFFSRKGAIGWRQMYSFSWKMTLSNLMYSMPRQLDIIFFKLFFGLNTIGLYSAAKSIFRVFDEALAAANGIIYPAAVRFFTKNDTVNLKLLAVKGLSFLFMAFVLLAFVLELGVADFIFNVFLPIRYIQSLGYFKILAFAALFLPFQMLFLFIIAKNRLNAILIYYSIGLLTFLVTISIIGFGQYIHLLPLGLVVYYAIMAIFAFFDSKKNLNLKNKDLFRSISDTKEFFLRK